MNLSTIKAPHWLILALSLLQVVAVWLTVHMKNGDIVFPAAIAGILPFAIGAIGWASPSVSPDTNIRAAKMAHAAGLASTAMLMIVLGVGCISPAKKTAVGTLGVDATVCALNHYGEPADQVALTCGIEAIPDVLKIFEAHKAAMTRELADAGPVKP